MSSVISLSLSFWPPPHSLLLSLYLFICSVLLCLPLLSHDAFHLIWSLGIQRTRPAVHLQTRLVVLNVCCLSVRSARCRVIVRAASPAREPADDLWPAGTTTAAGSVTWSPRATRWWRQSNLIWGFWSRKDYSLDRKWAFLPPITIQIRRICYCLNLSTDQILNDKNLK